MRYGVDSLGFQRIGFRSFALNILAWRFGNTEVLRGHRKGEDHAATYSAKRSQKCSPNVRQDRPCEADGQASDPPNDIQMALRDGTARTLVGLLSDGATGHDKQFRDSKIGRRRLSSEKGRLSLEITLVTTPFCVPAGILFLWSGVHN